ncbi:MAG: glycerate kinase [Firmicutes bacterium]|nr:glycerate kinase [Alicyclobacillaceae bacterium]MCL6496461.1 glycerate kinase [Bacillota bacterium]
MRVIVAPDSFKGALDAFSAARALASGVRRALPEARVTELPVADGGEGTAAVLLAALGGSWATVTVPDPLGRPVVAPWARLDTGGAVVEAAAAIGWALVPEAWRDPWHLSSAGLGHLLLAAVASGAREVAVALGGTGTNDGGLGLLLALGARCEDARRQVFRPTLYTLDRVRRVDLRPARRRLGSTAVTALVDVFNPLDGPRGATAVFGPQKGVTPNAIAVLDRRLARFGRVLEAASGLALRERQGAGAAGGLGAALAALTGGNLVSGIEVVLDRIGFEGRAAGSDLVLTGEGRTDAQTLEGKAVLGVVRRARRLGVPVVCLSGAVAEEAYDLYAHGCTAIWAVADGPMTLAEAVARTPILLERAAEAAVRLWAAGRAPSGFTLPSPG